MTLCMSRTFFLKNLPAHYFTTKNVIERSQLQEKLIHAGYRSPDSLMYFYAIKTLLLFLLPIIAFVSTTLFQNLDTKTTMYVILFAAALGLFSPNYYLHKKITTRQELVIDAFPDALDLLVVCTEAGLGLNAALQRVGQELIHNHPLLASELILVNAETRAGVDRIEALMGLARRTGIEDIKGLVSLLGQSISMGSSIAETLRIYAEDFRDKRMQRAEELAAKLGTKMLFPMMICFFPGIFIVAVGPAVLKLITVFGSH